MSKQILTLKNHLWRLSIVGALLILLLAACGDSDEAALPTSAPQATLPTASEQTAVDPAAQPTEQTAAVAPSAEPTVAPSPTPQLAALVNNRPITLARYESELARYEQAQQSLGQTAGADGTDYRQLVLNALIEQALIEQTAESRGIIVTEEMVNAKIEELNGVAGGPENFQSWLDANQLTAEEFATSLEAEMVTEQVVSQITAEVPFAVEQVRARYIQVDNAELAQTIVQQARAGTDFANLAQTYSLDTATGQVGGDLGYFARGSLLIPELEAAAFALPVDGVSDVITLPRDGQTIYYIIKVIERDEARPLPADQRARLLQETFENWLQEQLNRADIIVYEGS